MSNTPGDLLISGITARRLINNIRHMFGRKYRGSPLWVFVRYITGQGSGYSRTICISANFHPDQLLGRGERLPYGKGGVVWAEGGSHGS